MTTTTIVPLKVEQKPSKTKPNSYFWTVSTNLGFFSVFDKIIADKLTESLNKEISVEFAEHGNFRNIQSISNGLPASVNPYFKPRVDFAKAGEEKRAT